MRTALLFVLLLGAAGTLRAAGAMAEGIVYLKDGTRVEYTGRDRIELPRQWKDVKAFRNAFSKKKDKEKATYQPSDIDSIVCWHPQGKEYPRKICFVPPMGWCWVYAENPHIRVLLYAKKGYILYSSGGMRALYKQKTFNKTEMTFYLLKSGESDPYTIGGLLGNSSDAFRKRICAYIADDPDLCERIRQSSSIRSKTMSMLEEYAPQGR